MNNWYIASLFATIIATTHIVGLSKKLRYSAGEPVFVDDVYTQLDTLL